MKNHITKYINIYNNNSNNKYIQKLVTNVIGGKKGGGFVLLFLKKKKKNPKTIYNFVQLKASRNYFISDSYYLSKNIGQFLRKKMSF